MNARPEESRGIPWKEAIENRTAVVIAVSLLLVAATLIVATLRRPEPPTFAPSPIVGHPAEARLVGPLIYTVDARRPDRWQFFSFSQGSVSTDPAPSEWDLGFRRFQVIVNGGEGFSGFGGVANLGAVPFDSIQMLPDQGYQGTRAARGDSIAAPLESWYTYSYFTHLLNPEANVYAVRTADGRYAKIRFLGYYCPGARPGCVTFEYVFQGAGGRDLRSGGAG